MQIELITDIPYYRATRYPVARFVEWTGDKHVSITAEGFVTKIVHYTALLQQFKISAGMRVATYSQSTRIDMIAAEFAVMRMGGIVCPIHWTSLSRVLENAMRNLAPQFCLVGDENHRRAIESLTGALTEVKIVQLDILDRSSTTYELPGLPSSESSALIISTSGTSGDSKGVVLSHRNLISTALAGAAVVPINAKHTILSFLPISHILERSVLYSTMLLGAEMHFADSPRHAYLLTGIVRPHYFTGVPRNLERTFVRFKHASNERGFFTRQIFEWSLRQGKRGSVLGPAVARRFVLRKLRRLFGQRIKGIIVGGAAMNPDIIRWFDMAGIKVREGYGLSETAGVVAFNRFTPGEYKFGTAGRALPGVEIKIDRAHGDELGQIMVRGPSLMQGYIVDGKFDKFNPQDGWLATGDTGFIDEQGFIIIAGRLKDNFKNSFGEYVSPIRIEQKLELEIGVERAIVIGFQRPFTSAIIRPDFEFIATWAKSNNVHWTAPEYMVHNPDIIQYYQKRIDDINKTSQPHERILGFALVADNWTEESGLLTSTMKLRREVIQERYQKVVRGIYN